MFDPSVRPCYILRLKKANYWSVQDMRAIFKLQGKLTCQRLKINVLGSIYHFKKKISHKSVNGHELSL